MSDKVRQVFMWEIDGEQFPETASQYPAVAVKRLRQFMKHSTFGEASDLLLRGRFVLVTLGKNVSDDL